MRRFNPERELNKIQHGKRNKVIFSVLALLILIGIGSTYALYQVRYSKRIIYTKVAPFSSKDLDLAVYVNGEKQTKAPKENSGYKLLDMLCDKSYEGTVSWDDTEALLSFKQMQIAIPNKCNIYLIDNNYDEIKSFDFKGKVQEYTVEKDGYYKIELWGAGGGLSFYHTKYNDLPGQGAYTKGIIYLEQGTNLYIYVGQKGETGKLVGNNNGTFNGGGAGNVGSDGDDAGGSGGGATDVRLKQGTTWDDFESLKSRIMVAAGGAGTAVIGSLSNQITAGSGGGLTGVGESWHWQNVKFDNSFNATQKTGFKFGKGGNGQSNGLGGSGGGGGYYGGLADTINSAFGSGGGGSSFISGHQGCDAIEETATESTITHSGTPNHYSNKIFTATVMIDGLGYYWTDTRQTYIGMPTFDGTGTMEGNRENGYAKIAYLGN